MRLIFALAFVLLATVVYANPLSEEKSDGEDKEGDVQLNDPAELENDDDSIDENVHDARARRVRTSFYDFLFSLSYKRTISLLIRLFCFNKVPTRPPLRFDFSTRTNSITILLLFCFSFRVAKGGLHSVWQGARAKEGV